MKHGARVGLWSLALGGVLVACAPEDYFIDNTNPDPVYCEQQIDCYLNGNLEVGTDCIQNKCLCHEPGEALQPCCKKGNDPNDCDRKCRQADQCADPQEPIGSTGAGGNGAGGASVGGSGTGGAGGVSGGDCETAADCPGSADLECGEAKCIDGRCRLDFKPLQKITSQIRGDCVSLYCDGQGTIATLPDGEDRYNDGRQCTFDTCENGQWVNIELPDGSPCPETGLGVCSAGQCVACIAILMSSNDCGNGFACDNTQCVPAVCVNMMFDANQGETDLDCGGPCAKCPVGYTCTAPADCQHGACVGGQCAPPSCTDMAMNDSETGIDCGGPPSCPRCPPGEGCQFGSDCASAVCWAGVCEAPKCNDGVQNGEELGVDCGGTCATCP